MPLLLLLLAATLAQSAAAQPAKPPATPAQSHAAKELLLVQPLGEIRPAPKETRLRLQTEILTEPVSTEEILRRNGLAIDANTTSMIKRLNPNYDWSKETLPAGAKIDLFAPERLPGAAAAAGSGLTFDSPLVARLAAREQVQHAQTVRTNAAQLSAKSFSNQKDLQIHRQSVADISKAATSLEKVADNLSPRDFAVARYQLDYSTRLAARINEEALIRRGIVPTGQVAQLRTVASTTQSMESRMLKGEPPVPLRRVKVTVLKQETSENVPGLSVYALPSGYLDMPSLFSSEEIGTALKQFSFLEETSPANQEVPIIDVRIWVGPKFKWDEMVRLIQQKKLAKYQVIPKIADLNLQAELLFRSPSDLVSP